MASERAESLVDSCRGASAEFERLTTDATFQRSKETRAALLDYIGELERDHAAMERARPKVDESTLECIYETIVIETGDGEFAVYVAEWLEDPLAKLEEVSDGPADAILGGSDGDSG